MLYHNLFGVDQFTNRSDVIIDITSVIQPILVGRSHAGADVFITQTIETILIVLYIRKFRILYYFKTHCSERMYD